MGKRDPTRFWKLDSPEYAKLHDRWMAKLKKSGFEDIEGPDGILIDYEAEKWALDKGPLHFTNKLDYYQRASQYLYTGTFKRGERRIWEMHCDGVTIRAIATKVRKTKDYVFRRIVAHRKKAGLTSPTRTATGPGFSEGTRNPPDGPDNPDDTP